MIEPGRAAASAVDPPRYAAHAENTIATTVSRRIAVTRASEWFRAGPHTTHSNKAHVTLVADTEDM